MQPEQGLPVLGHLRRRFLHIRRFLRRNPHISKEEGCARGTGCGHDNEGLFIGAASLLGLGRGRLSFWAQIGHQFNQKF
ncbi:hypothetical protein AHAS_Ahas04G0078300 [Arachis hypogaea]